MQNHWVTVEQFGIIKMRLTRNCGDQDKIASLKNLSGTRRDVDTNRTLTLKERSKTESG